MAVTVRDACKVREGAFDFVLSDQIEDLTRIIHEFDGRTFFEQNVVTKGMERLLRGALNRLGGKADNAVYHLTQAMGGGKTHAMIALGLLARNPGLLEVVAPDIAKSSGFAGSARVVALSGRVKMKRFLWGEIAAQLGHAEDFKQFYVNGPDAPDENNWLEILHGQPTLIMLDELPPYFDWARTRVVGNGTLATVTTYALSTLLSASLKTSNCCVVVSNLSGAYEQATADLANAMKDFEGELKRSAVNIQPVDLGGEEVFSILKKRIFAELPSVDAIDKVAEAYGRAIEEAERGSAIAKSAERVADQVHASYPFHPSLKDLLALFKNNENYRQTRGLIRIVARLVKCVWDRPANDVHLIGAQHFDLSDADVKSAVLDIADLDGAIATDIAGGGSAHAELIDADNGSDAATQVATLILFSSLSTAVEEVKGIDRQRMLEFLIDPDRPPSEFAAAFEKLQTSAWYLHVGKGDRWVFSKNENLKKRLGTVAEQMAGIKVDAEMRRRLEDLFRPAKGLAYQRVLPLPEIEKVAAEGDKRVLLIVSPDSTQPPEDVRRFYDALVEKNAFCFLTGEGDGFVKLDQHVRRILAVEKLKGEIDEKSPLWRELEEEGESAAMQFLGTVSASLSRLWYPLKNGLESAKLSLAFAGSSLDGEAQVEATLAATGVNKLILDVEAQADSLIQRAEDTLFGQGIRDMSMADLRSRAKTNPRWPWLPPKGLQDLVRIACSRGRWKQPDDSRVLIGPFEAEKTSVRVVEEHYDDLTGTAKLRAIAEHAGDSAVIHYSLEGDVSENSPVLDGGILTTDATSVRFLAVDPKGKHPTGTAIVWRNRLTIRHQVHRYPGYREVELAVVPRGAMRWSDDGSNAKEGKLYEAPFRIGDGETLISVFAQEGELTGERTFRIPADTDGKAEIDPTAPLTLKGRLSFGTSAEVLTFLGDQGVKRASLKGITLGVGQGSDNARLRFGSTVSLNATHISQSTEILRKALGNDGAEIDLSLDEVGFETGQDYLSFARNMNFDADAHGVDIEQ